MSQFIEDTYKFFERDYNIQKDWKRKRGSTLGARNKNWRQIFFYGNK